VTQRKFKWGYKRSDGTRVALDHLTIIEMGMIIVTWRQAFVHE
jgi:hypothetical protein